MGPIDKDGKISGGAKIGVVATRSSRLGRQKLERK
jgi:hypothetical protein